MEFARFMSSPLGRALRVVAGGVLVLLGLGFVSGTGGYVLAAVGALPIVFGLGNFCLFAPLVGGPFQGSRLAGKS